MGMENMMYKVVLDVNHLMNLKILRDVLKDVEKIN